jgi:hypothetical protein
MSLSRHHRQGYVQETIGINCHLSQLRQWRIHCNHNAVDYWSCHQGRPFRFEKFGDQAIQGGANRLRFLCVRSVSVCNQAHLVNGATDSTLGMQTLAAGPPAASTE